MTRLPTKFNRYIEPFVRATGACAALAEIRADGAVRQVERAVEIIVDASPEGRAPRALGRGPRGASLPVIVQPLTFNVAPRPRR